MKLSLGENNQISNPPQSKLIKFGWADLFIVFDLPV